MKKYLVWDLPVRLFHWGLVITLMALWYTAEQEGEMIDLHMQLGYIALGLIIFRVIWGFVGTTHARFMAFIPSFSKLKRYISEQKQGNEPHYAGHNPMGSLMVILMLLLVALQAVTGLFMTDDIFATAPYYGVLPAEVEKVMSIIHHNGFNVLLAAIALHIAAIVYYKKVKQKNLVTPMVTGKKSEKEASEQDAIPHSKLLLAIVLAVVVAAFVYWLVVLNAPAVEEFYY